MKKLVFSHFSDKTFHEQTNQIPKINEQQFSSLLERESGIISLQNNEDGVLSMLFLLCLLHCLIFSKFDLDLPRYHNFVPIRRYETVNYMIADG